MKHTPTPWTVKEDGEANRWTLIGPNGHWLLAFLSNGRELSEQQKANAEFIMRACNSHDELLEALKAFVNAFSGTAGASQFVENVTHAKKQADFAIANAEGGR